MGKGISQFIMLLNVSSTISNSVQQKQAAKYFIRSETGACRHPYRPDTCMQLLNSGKLVGEVGITNNNRRIG